MVAAPLAWAQSNLPSAERGSLSGDNVDHPLGKKQSELRKEGLKKLLKGEAQAKGSNKVVQVAKGQFVELARQGEDKIFTIVAEFGTGINPIYGGTAGPLRNQIPQPDRSVDNSTVWAPDFNKAHYEEMLFSAAPGAVSMRNFYIEQSSNRYTVNGDVTDWVKVPFNEANYGSDYCGGIVCARTWLFVRDAANAWYASQIAAGKTKAEINAYLAQFDTWDRYDANGDGSFSGGDHYIDHFQIIHAGEGEKTGGGAQGTDAIWSHRWYAFYNNIGLEGPPGAKLGGIRIGESDYWIGDYAVEPENGGVGVFSHEFGHDLGLPDLYDTSGNTGGAENSTGFWTLYSSGSYGSNGKPEDGIGTKPISMSALEKIQLGWSNYQVVGYKERASIKLGPATANTKQAQQIVAFLPDKKVVTSIGQPFGGAFMYYSGSGNNLDNSMTRQVTLPAGAALSAKVRYAIEQDWDYAYLTVNGTPVLTNRSTATNPNGQNFGNGITGSTGGNWVDLTANLVGLCRPDRHARLPLLDRRRRGRGRIPGRRHRGDRPGRRRRGDRGGMDLRRLHPPRAGRHEELLQRLFRRVSQLPRLRRRAAHRAVQLRLPGQPGAAELGRALPVSGRAAGLVLRRVVPGQQCRRLLPCRTLRWLVPAGRCASGADAAAGQRQGLAAALPVVRLDLRARSDGQRLHQREQPARLLRRTGGQSALQRQRGLLGPPNPAIGHFGWSGVQVPKTGTTMRVKSMSAQDNFMQVQVNQ